MVEPRAGLALGDHPVQRVHAGCFHADQNLSAPRLGPGSLLDFDTGRIAVRVDSRGSHPCRRMPLRSFALCRALGQFAEWRGPLAPPPLDGVWALWLAFGFEPSAGESRLPKPAPDVRAAPHEVPQETGPLVLDHHDDRTLIQTVIQRADPVAEGRIQAGPQAIFAAQVGVCANKLSKRVRDKFRCKRKRCRDAAGRQRAIIRSVGYTPSFVHPEIPIDVIDGLRHWSGTVAGAQTPAERPIAAELLRILLGVALLHAHCTATVLEIVEPLGLHEPIANSAKIEPAVTELVNE